jgi:hypothetical protein
MIVSFNDLTKGDAVIIPEPFNQSIVTAQLGVLWFRGKQNQ